MHAFLEHGLLWSFSFDFHIHDAKHVIVENQIVHNCCLQMQFSISEI